MKTRIVFDFFKRVRYNAVNKGKKAKALTNAKIEL